MGRREENVRITLMASWRVAGDKRLGWGTRWRAGEVWPHLVRFLILGSRLFHGLHFRPQTWEVPILWNST